MRRQIGGRVVRRTVVVFAMLAAGCMAKVESRGASKSALEDCEPALFGESGLFYLCPNGRYALVAEDRESAASKLLDLLILGLDSAPGHRLVTHEAHYNFGGISRRAFAIEHLEESSGEHLEWGYAFAISLPEGSRAVACVSQKSEETLCRKTLDELASTGPSRDTIAKLLRRVPTPTFAGRPYPIPQGCHALEEGHVVCVDTARLQWLTPPSPGDARGFNERNIHFFEQSLTGVKRSHVACNVGGESSACTIARSSTLTLIAGYADINGKIVIAACQQPTPYPPLHPLCATVFEIATKQD